MTTFFTPDDKGELLIGSCEQGDWEYVSSFMTTKNINLNFANNDGKTAMWWAAYHQKWDIVRKLINLGADASTTAIKGEHAGKSVLWFALSYQNWGMVETLLQLPIKNIDLAASVTGNNGENVLWLAAFYGKWELFNRLSYLIKHKHIINLNDTPISGPDSNKSILYLAAKSNRFDIVEKLLKEKKLSNKRTKNDYTLLDSCLDSKVIEEHPKLVYLLTKYLAADNASYKSIKFPAVTPSAKVTEESLNKIYYNDEASRAIHLKANFLEQNGALKQDILDKKNVQFFKEINVLMDKFKDLAAKTKEKDLAADTNDKDLDVKKKHDEDFNLDNIVDGFEKFKKIIRNAERFHQANPSFYETMKRNLEEIYFLINAKDFNEDEKAILLDELSSQLQVCGPGIFNSILMLRQSLSIGDLAGILANYREKIVRKCAAKAANQHQIQTIMKSHVDSAFIMAGEQLSLSLPSGPDLLKNGDIFVDIVYKSVKPNEIKKSVVHDIDEDYCDFNKLSKFIKESFVDELHKLWPENTALNPEEYDSINEQFKILQKKYGLSKDIKDGNHNLLQYNEDFTKIMFNYQALDYCISLAMIENRVIETKIDEFVVNKNKFNYFVIGSKVYLSEINIDGGKQYYYNEEAINKILSLKSQNIELSVELMRAALIADYQKKLVRDSKTDTFSAKEPFNFTKQLKSYFAGINIKKDDEFLKVVYHVQNYMEYFTDACYKMKNNRDDLLQFCDDSYNKLHGLSRSIADINNETGKHIGNGLEKMITSMADAVLETSKTLKQANSPKAAHCAADMLINLGTYCKTYINMFNLNLRFHSVDMNNETYKKAFEEQRSEILNQRQECWEKFPGFSESLGNTMKDLNQKIYGVAGKVKNYFTRTPNSPFADLSKNSGKPNNSNKI